MSVIKRGNGAASEGVDAVPAASSSLRFSEFGFFAAGLQEIICGRDVTGSIAMFSFCKGTRDKRHERRTEQVRGRSHILSFLLTRARSSLLVPHCCQNQLRPWHWHDSRLMRTSSPLVTWPMTQDRTSRPVQARVWDGSGGGGGEWRWQWWEWTRRKSHKTG